jgi:hypothetical protein
MGTLANASKVGLVVFLGQVAVTLGCIQAGPHRAYDVKVEVCDSQTGRPLPEWVLVSATESSSGWSRQDAERTVETTCRLVAAQNPRENTYRVQSRAGGGIVLAPGLGYGGWEEEIGLIYVVGYEIGVRIGETDAGAPYPESGQAAAIQRRYALCRWDNNQANPAVVDVLRTLLDPRNFGPYEALRSTPQGAGVPALYRYYIERYKAIVDANPGIQVEPAVMETVSWLRQAVAGKMAPLGQVSPTTVRRVPGGNTPEQVFRTIAKDADTGKPLDSWVAEVALMELSSGAPRPVRWGVLAVELRTVVWPDTRVPPFVHTERRDGAVVRFLACPIVYAAGYEPSARPGDALRGATQGSVVECLLRKWDNGHAQAIKDFVSLLEDDERFEQYERLRRQGAIGVLDLYRYMQGRCDALDGAARTALSAKAKQRLAWIRQQVTGKVATYTGGAWARSFYQPPVL